MFCATRRDTQRAFTLIELLVVIAIIAILAAILFPVFAKAREKARQTTCLSNCKQMGLGLMQYSQDYDEQYPFDAGDTAGYGWIGPGPLNPATPQTTAPFDYPALIQPYLKNWQLFQCPSCTPSAANGMSYWSNGAIFCSSSTTSVGDAAVTEPSQVIVLYDDIGAVNRVGQVVFRPYWTGGTFTDGGSLESLTNGAPRPGPHNYTINNLYADGHAKNQNNSEIYNQLLVSRVWP